MSRASNLAGFTTSISPPANLSVGIITASSVINVGTGLTLSSGGINITGVITATSFSGNGSGLTGAGIGTTGSVNTSGIITASSFSGNGSGLTGVAATTLTIGAGTTALPSISPTGDTNTGIFFPSADTIAFSEGGAEAMRVDSSGRLLIGISTSGNANGGKLQLSSGITFPATAVAATDANTLDDYEEGTWTPRLNGWNGSAYIDVTNSQTTYTTSGIYRKIGNLVWVSFYYEWTTIAIASGNPFYLRDLPFAVATTGNVTSGTARVSNVTNAYSATTYTDDRYADYIFLMLRTSISAEGNGPTHAGGAGLYQGTIAYIST